MLDPQNQQQLTPASPDASGATGASPTSPATAVGDQTPSGEAQAQPAPEQGTLLETPTIRVKFEGHVWEDIPREIASDDQRLRAFLTPWFPEVATADIHRDPKSGVVTLLKRGGAKGVMEPADPSSTITQMTLATAGAAHSRASDEEYRCQATARALARLREATPYLNPALAFAWTYQIYCVLQPLMPLAGQEKSGLPVPVSATAHPDGDADDLAGQQSVVTSQASQTKNEGKEANDSSNKSTSGQMCNILELSDVQDMQHEFADALDTSAEYGEETDMRLARLRSLRGRPAPFGIAL